MSESLYLLIIDDHPEDAELILNELRAAGFDPLARLVETESDFLAALSHTPDLILTDYRLREFNALRALQLLRERALDIPLIIVAASIGEELAVEAIKQGAADYLKKDRLMRLGAAVNRALEEKKIREEKRQSEARLRYLSMHDQLTGLYNRAYFEEELARLERGRRNPVSAIMTDVDGLKAVNDEQGHAAGDDLLLNAALLLGSIFRRDDVVARIGGDEFCILLPGADSVIASGAAQRVKRALIDFNRTHKNNLLSLSLGIATGDCKSVLKTLQEADVNMYVEKMEHRTRARISQEPEPSR